MKRRKLSLLLDALAKAHGEPKPLRRQDPIEIALKENVAYLLDDEARDVAFAALKKKVGTKPHQILGAKAATLLEVAKLGGMRPEDRVEKLRKVAEVAMAHHQELDQLFDIPIAKARRALKKFPGIGDPGADKILLFTGVRPYLALESNGLRVLQRLGFAKEEKSYAQSYKAAQAAADPELAGTIPARTRAFHLLRMHGRTTCKRSDPRCEACPLTSDCAYFAAR
jgi:endonuclease III